jgi:Tfp pilus assembly protein PilV
MQFQSTRQSRRPRHRAAGFSILEVAMSSFVLAFSVMTSLTVVQSGYRTMDNARNTTIASQLLQSVMEDMRMLPYTATGGANSISSLEAASSNNTTGNVTLDSSFTNGDAIAAAMVARFTITRNITDVSGSTSMKLITLTATWKGIDTRTHTLSYSSYYCQNGLHDYYVR